jgi:hypothetical protein
VSVRSEGFGDPVTPLSGGGNRSMASPNGSGRSWRGGSAGCRADCCRDAGAEEHQCPARLATASNVPASASHLVRRLRSAGESSAMAGGAPASGKPLPKSSSSWLPGPALDKPSLWGGG